MLKRIKNLFNIKNNEDEAELSTEEKIDCLFDNLYEDIILLHLGEDLAAFGQLFCNIIQQLRDEIKNECGFILPNVHVQDCSILQENEFLVFIRGERVEDGFLIPNEKGINEEFYDIFKTVIYNRMEDIFTNSLAERYIDIVQRKNGWLICNLSRVLSVPEIKIILSDIINNGKSINDIDYVFEKIGENVLLDGGYQDWYGRKYNPHEIAKRVTKVL